MTITSITNQLFTLSLGGFFNGEKFTRQQLNHHIANAMRTGDKYIMEIALPDGKWLFQISRWSDKPDGFDFFIPETREQETHLWKTLLG